MINLNFKKILDSVSPLWGICDYGKIKDNLIECRAKSRLPENAKAVIIACFPYLLPKENYINSNISKYAVVTDYHDVAIGRLQKACDELKKLYPLNSFAPFADNSPIPEVRAATLAGLGVRGENSLLITKEFGSYVFLGEIVTDLPLDAANSEVKSCFGCGKCADVCPANAINKSGVDGEKCLSAITQKKGELTQAEKELMKSCGCVWGCDICQDICPMNKSVSISTVAEFLADPIPVLTNETSLDGRAYAWRGKRVIERNLTIINQGENGE